ncbi:hypothetical protein [Gluconacetobacter sp.]|uniref:hypothetical protein n=1 Tax=Gluconacetobacter sp. TaxID=1935994 RepID=UPI0039E87EA0
MISAEVRTICDHIYRRHCNCVKLERALLREGELSTHSSSIYHFLLSTISRWDQRLSATSNALDEFIYEYQAETRDEIKFFLLRLVFRNYFLLKDELRTISAEINTIRNISASDFKENDDAFSFWIHVVNMRERFTKNWPLALSNNPHSTSDEMEIPERSGFDIVNVYEEKVRNYDDILAKEFAKPALVDPGKPTTQERSVIESI